MRKLTIAIFVALLSLPAFAETGEGFKGDETPPPPHKQDSGYKGMEDTHNITISHLKELREGAWVTLKGNIIKKIADDHYQFRDKTGTIDIKLAKDTWNGEEVTPNDLVTISGKVGKDLQSVNVEHFRKE
ncbi:YgiW/YdeI family stress tolerance OB fold protein [Edaphovirga cremea]|uniref:YgiW/YdeI family stress tolerance OB fold protein n=1 Tax=Edaphovirga cremea TaxID=2267246 RepID=UPI000DEEA7D8|nr:YgiW/YdeI family stress tolerance OB fold protein [Edaphovirga cremea]